MPKSPHPEQGELLVVSSHSNQAVAREFFGESNQLQVEIEKNLHLQNALTGIFKMNMLRPFVGHEQIAESFYGDEAENVRTGAETNLRKLVVTTKLEFAKAVGHFDRLDAGEDPEVVKADTRIQFSEFLKSYSGAKNTKSAHQFRQKLVEEAKSLNEDQDAESYTSEFNRRQGLRPYDKTTDSQEMVEESQESSPQLSNRQRLLSFMLDPRAGFVPKHNGELDQMLSWLDYLDNPENPLGINNQLGEVFGKGRWPSGKSKQKGPWLGDEFGVRAVESVTWKVGDFLLESEKRLHKLGELQKFVNEEGSPTLKMFDLCNQTDDEVGSYSLEGLFGEHWFGLAALVQYSDIMEYIDTGEVKALARHPLSTTEDPPRSQRPDFSAVPGKRKTVYNHYTGGTMADKTGEYEVHIIAKLKQMTVKEARKLMPQCLEDANLENSFMRRRMNELSDFDQGPSQPIHDAISAIRHQLKLLTRSNGDG